MGGSKMTKREAVKVLMLSPFYFKLDLPTRKILVKEFCSVTKKIEGIAEINTSNN